MFSMPEQYEAAQNRSETSNAASEGLIDSRASKYKLSLGIGGILALVAGGIGAAIAGNLFIAGTFAFNLAIVGAAFAAIGALVMIGIGIKDAIVANNEENKGVRRTNNTINQDLDKAGEFHSHSHERGVLTSVDRKIENALDKILDNAIPDDVNGKKQVKGYLRNHIADPEIRQQIKDMIQSNETPEGAILAVCQGKLDPKNLYKEIGRITVTEKSTVEKQTATAVRKKEKEQIEDYANISEWEMLGGKNRNKNLKIQPDLSLKNTKNKGTSEEV